MNGEPVSPADTIRLAEDGLAELRAAVADATMPTLFTEDARGLLKAWDVLLAVGERDKAETERLREELGCSLGCKLPAGHPGDHDFDPDWPYEVTLRQEREAGERDRRQIARLAKALDRLAQEVENECRGRPSKQRLRHRATLARQDLAAVLADEEAAANG